MSNTPAEEINPCILYSNLAITNSNQTSSSNNKPKINTIDNGKGNNVYLMKQKPTNQKKHTYSRNNHSLPSIGIQNNFQQKEEKVNTIRNQIDDAKN